MTKVLALEWAKHNVQINAISPTVVLTELGKKAWAGEVGGAKSAQGGSLDEVIRVAQKAIDSTRSIGVGLTSCTIPAAGKPNFHIEAGKMEVGIGHHGEPGVQRKHR